MYAPFRRRRMEIRKNANDAPPSLHKPRRLRYPHAEFPVRDCVLFTPLLSPNLLPKRARLLASPLRCPHRPHGRRTISLLNRIRSIRLPHKTLRGNNLVWLRSLVPRLRSHAPTHTHNTQMAHHRLHHHRRHGRRSRLPTHSRGGTSTFPQIRPCGRHFRSQFPACAWRRIGACSVLGHFLKCVEGIT